ncbi:hypothetical protein AYL99_10872 [Fonsecaea erecta]|uniref:SWR1-complex protein 3 domain-containing protein n=1 Tax=Fonsecaea erecta TaxID=1367422 RepID=A0A178Z635_9EURO|nr:hypothetical protein AYL99_10872 [Fonsecaea erecta]OAP55172.1 hypothetical protein AYL99_10872 [Fonsecaea erecta]
MAETTPQKRVLPARDRRDPASKRKASSPAHPATPASASTPAVRRQASAVSSEPRQKRPYKKRASLVRVQTPVSASRSSPSISVGEDVLPTRLVANQPLPTTKQKQPSDLPVREYQSIAESAVLAASLHRSRMQWLYHGIFEKYWVKPVKRKGIIEAPPNNPDAKSMQRLGAATMTIEPHTFDVIFYTVRDQTAPPQYQRHPNQHTIKNVAAQPPPPPPTSYATHPPVSPYHHAQPMHPPPSVSPSPATPAAPQTSHPPAPIKDAPPSAAPSPSQGGPPQIQIKHENDSEPSLAALASKNPPVVSHPEQSLTPRPESKPNPPPGARGSTTDPVIQMLAARAASDPQLKELMKIVATSRASNEQLKEFQAHIDEFNEVIRRQEVERLAKSEPRPPSQQPLAKPPVAETSTKSPLESKPAVPSPIPPGPPSNPPIPSHVAVSGRSSTLTPPQPPPRQHPNPAPPGLPPAGPPPGPGALPGVMHTFPHAPPPPGRGGPMGNYFGYHSLPQPPPARPDAFIKHIVMEITSVPSGTQSACPDRWLFPEYAVLEIRPGGLEMICSFLVERKGAQIMAGGEPAAEKVEVEGKWQAEQEYYQPVTMSIKALNHRTIETIAKAAKILPVVQEHMKEVMSEKRRAPVEYLVHHLPREPSHVGAEGAETGFVDSGVDLGSDSASEDDELMDVYGI